MIDLNSLPLDPTTYSSLISLTGVIEKDFSNGKYLIKLDDGALLPITLHPKVIEAYDEQNYFVSESDEVDMLGCYVSIDDKPEIVILRCVIYKKTPTLIS